MFSSKNSFNGNTIIALSHPSFDEAINAYELLSEKNAKKLIQELQAFDLFMQLGGVPTRKARPVDSIHGVSYFPLHSIVDYIPQPDGKKKLRVLGYGSLEKPVILNQLFPTSLSGSLYCNQFKIGDPRNTDSYLVHYQSVLNMILETIYISKLRIEE
jgi:hypothetical protein